MTKFTFLQLLDDPLSRYKQINESSSSVNISTCSCVETVFPENDDDLFPKRDTLSTWMQTSKKGTREKGTQYKDPIIRNKFTQSINAITYNTIGTQTMPHKILVLVWNQGKTTPLVNQK